MPKMPSIIVYHGLVISAHRLSTYPRRNRALDHPGPISKDSARTSGERFGFVRKHSRRNLGRTDLKFDDVKSSLPRTIERSWFTPNPRIPDATQPDESFGDVFTNFLRGLPRIILHKEITLWSKFGANVTISHRYFPCWFILVGRVLCGENWQ